MMEAGRQGKGNQVNSPASWYSRYATRSIRKLRTIASSANPKPAVEFMAYDGKVV